MSIFNHRPKAWRIPAGKFYPMFDDMASQPHLLIAGATGSGKSVVINGILYNLLLHNAPGQVQLILIDPKRVELVRYRDLPHTIAYASEPDSMVQALASALTITDRRYAAMQRQRVLKWQGGQIYVVIDELADLMTTDKKHVMPLIQRLCQIGRAAGVHVIAATQCPLSAVIPTPIKVNFDSRVGLRTRSAQDSRNILGGTGCERLPRYGQGYYMTPEGTHKYLIPMYSDDRYEAILHHWTSKACRA